MTSPGGHAYGHQVSVAHGSSGLIAHPAFIRFGVTDIKPLFVGNAQVPRFAISADDSSRLVACSFR